VTTFSSFMHETGFDIVRVVLSVRGLNCWFENTDFFVNEILVGTGGCQRVLNESLCCDELGDPMARSVLLP
jgi:hypothetical protein